MVSPYERMIAWRYLRPQKGERFIAVVAGFSLIGIALGVAALIIVMSVMNGFRAELFDRILGVNGHAIIQGYDGKLRNWQPLIDKVRQQPGIVSATPLIEQQLMVSRQNRSQGAIVRGILPADLAKQTIVADNVLEGSLRSFRSGEPVAAIGARLAEKLFVRTGDSITLIAPEGQVTPFGVTPRIASYQIVAIFEVGVYDYDNAFVFLPMDIAQTYFALDDSIGAIEIITDDPDRVAERMAPLVPLVQPIGVISDWRSLNQALFSALEVERNVMFLILTIIILVAAFNIISSLIMLVRAKNKDIAILRTMGASRAAMMRIFVAAGTSIGVIGTLLGLVLGVIVTNNIQAIQRGVAKLTGADIWNPEIRFLTEMPAKMDMGEVFTVVAIALLLTLLATLYPSWRAANTDPVQVLRYE
jgi:lipoprotein-releasing system permease protein